MKMGYRVITFAVGGALAMSSCVSMQKFRALETRSQLEQFRAEVLEEENSRLTEDLMAAQGSVDNLTQDKKKLKKTTESLKEDKAREIKKMKKTYEGLVRELKGEIEKGQIKITNIKGKLSVSVAEKIFFGSGKSELKKGGETVLAKVAGVLKNVKGKQIHVEGHTDNIPIGPKLRQVYPTNWELSASRALTVVRYLHENGGISPKILSGTGYGSYRPVASNRSRTGRARNRRIEIVLMDKDAGQKKK